MVCRVGVIILLTARLPRAALAARWTSTSELWRRKRMGSRVSRSTSRTSRQVSKCWGGRPDAARGHTTLGDFGKSQACAALKVYIFRKYQGAESSEGLAGEEVGLSTLLYSQPRKRRGAGHGRGNRHFRETGEDRRQPRVHYRRGRVRRGYLGIGLLAGSKSQRVSSGTAAVRMSRERRQRQRQGGRAGQERTSTA